MVKYDSCHQPEYPLSCIRLEATEIDGTAKTNSKIILNIPLLLLSISTMPVAISKRKTITASKILAKTKYQNSLLDALR